MYFTNISNNELQQFHEQVKVNLKVRIEDLTNYPFIKTENMDDILKIYPLFYVDKIESTNSNDKVFENKCIICENKPDTTIYFISDENVPVLSLDYSYYTDYENFLVFYLYDGFNSSSLYNVEAEVVLKNDDVVVSELTKYSNRNGVIYLDISKFEFDNISIVFTCNGSSKSFNWD